MHSKKNKDGFTSKKKFKTLNPYKCFKLYYFSLFWWTTFCFFQNVLFFCYILKLLLLLILRSNNKQNVFVMCERQIDECCDKIFSPVLCKYLDFRHTASMLISFYVVFINITKTLYFFLNFIIFFTQLLSL